MKFHFIAGLPRSGTTLLAALLRQNPRFTATVMSPTGFMFNQLQESMSRQNEASSFISDVQRARVLRGLLESYYADTGADVVFDNNRRWPPKLPVLSAIFPDCKMLCCVRPVEWIVDSVERQVRENPLSLSTIFSYKANMTVFDRAQQLIAPTGIVGYAYNAVQEAYYGPHADRLLVIEYDAFVKRPAETFARIYKFLGEHPFPHDFDNVQQIPGTAEFDADLASPGLHTVGKKVQWKQQETILPPSIFQNCPAPFWR